ncbi:MAG: hypothetical protein ACR2RL_13460 [Gammaproteobacteria bacterium]
MRAERIGSGPIVVPGMDARMGDNINGPSLISAPPWLESPLGHYYLYFAHHDGRYIRLAHADELSGPWRMHEPGVLPLAESGFAGHIASPDVHVDTAERRVRMYFHGSDTPTGGGGEQWTRVAVSHDGLHFEANPHNLCEPYLRMVHWHGMHLGLAMPGVVYRSADGLSEFERGPTLFDADMRHSALLLEGSSLNVFYTHVGDRPERILLSRIDLSSDWLQWRESPPRVLLEPERDYEGADAVLRPSVRGIVDGPVRELRDPAVYVEDGERYLLYAVAGESGIALAKLIEGANE